MMTELKLAPCPNPWCSHEKGLHIIWNLYRRQVHCIDCQIRGPHGATDEEAITAWNTRPPSRNDALEEAAKPFVKYFNDRRDFYIRRHGKNGGIGAANFDKMPDDWPMENATFTMGDFRKLSRALKDRDG